MIATLMFLRAKAHKLGQVTISRDMLERIIKYILDQEGLEDGKDSETLYPPATP